MAEEPGKVKVMLIKENINSGFGMLIRDNESSGL